MFIIHEVLRPVTYKIQYEDGRVVTNAWNIEHLHPFYPLVNVQNSCVNKYMPLVFDSHVSEFQTYSTVFLFPVWQTFKLEQITSLHQDKDAPCSGATKGTMPSCLLVFSKIFKKKIRQPCQDQLHERKVF
jgi:hypothetical protein